jgi:phage gp36-like protein
MARPPGYSSYATIAQIMERYPNSDLLQITDANGVVIQEPRLQAQLDDASDMIDSYISGRYAWPLDFVPEVLVACCSDIAMYRIQALRPLHDIADARKRFEDWRTYLEKVARGELSLGSGGWATQTITNPDGSISTVVVPGSGLTPAISEPNVMLKSDNPLYGRLFTRDLLRNY